MNSPSTPSTTTPTNAINDVQSDSPQELTKAAPTASFSTSAMSFGEIGTTFEQETTGFAGTAHSVGEFADTQLLERMMLVDQVTWPLGGGGGTLFNQDIDKILREYSRNADILKLFRFYHTDIEVTLRLNTNQFYYGLLMVTLYPGLATGDWLSERAVLDPTTISASTAESVIKTWAWTWPMPWRGLNDTDNLHHPVFLTVEALVDLFGSNPDLPNSITIQIWARFKNIKLAYPSQNTDQLEADFRKYAEMYAPGEDLPLPPIPDDTQTQSGKPRVAMPTTKRTTHPAQDPSRGNPITDLVESVAAVPMQAIDGLVGTVSGVLDTGLGTLLGGLFDKPDDETVPEPMIIEGSRDLFGADTADSNVYLGLRKGRYLDPGPSRMPMSDNWTLRKYGQIPGIRTIKNFTSAGGGAGTLDIPLVLPTTTGDGFRTPLDYVTKCAVLSRGSIKVCLQFVAASFISARFVVQLWRVDGQHGPDSEYDYGISRVINVKGDTLDTFTVPWLDPTWWVENDPRQLRIKLDSDIATTDVASASKIFLVVWLACGEDFQFQFPRVPLATEWPLTEPEQDSTRTQASIGKLFSDKFVPIVDNVFYDEDHGFATNETVELMTDVAKRYSPMNFQGGVSVGYQPLTFNANALDIASAASAQYVQQRRTLFGSMRACFLFRSGGYRYRVYTLQAGNLVWTATSGGSRTLFGTVYPHPFDSISRMTVGQISTRPFIMINDDQSPQAPPIAMGLTATELGAKLHLAFLAARDDLQFGYPVLPKGIPPTLTLKKKDLPKTDLRKASSGVRKKQPS